MSMYMKVTNLYSGVWMWLHHLQQNWYGMDPTARCWKSVMDLPGMRYIRPKLGQWQDWSFTTSQWRTEACTGYRPATERVKSGPTSHWMSKVGPDLNWELCSDCIWNVMAHAQEPDFVFRRNGRVHWNWWVFQFDRLLAAEVRASAVVMLDTPCSEVVWRVLAIHSILQFPLQLPFHASPCAITFQLHSTSN